MDVVLVIDMLNDFFRQPDLARQREGLTAQIHKLLKSARQFHLPVIWVRQEFRPDLTDAFRAMRKRNVSITIAGTPGAQVLSELDCRATDREIIKKRYSAFYGTDLEPTLEQLQAGRLVVAGINTHACVRMTVIDAYQRDLEVVIPQECVASYDAEHHAMTLAYLGRDLADVKALEEVVAELRSERSIG